MRINKIELKNFKRFTDLTIENIPSTAKLVLLIGANGSGKSSVFDALHNFKVVQPNGSYFLKSKKNGQVNITFDNGKTVGHIYGSDGTISHSYQPLDVNFIGRSSIRIIPRISNDANPDQIKDDRDRPHTFIDPDTRLANDVFAYMQRIDDALRAPVFKGQSADTVKIFHDVIQPFNDSLINIFSGDARTTIQVIKYQNATPYAPPQLIFKKGNAEINYDLLSHGEKQVVILLLNFIVRQEQYENAIIYIDEMDCHLNTTLQTRLLEEIVTKWIPDSSQLWTASHSLGFIDYARKSELAAIIDLDNLDFDMPQVINQETKDNLDVYEIALPKELIASILADKKLVITENKNSALYNLALGEKSYLFLPANNNREVFLTIKDDKSKIGLRDKDYLRDDEIAAIKEKFPNLKILEYYTFENYLYHPDNIAEIIKEGFDRAAYIEEITGQKNQHILGIISKIAPARQTYVEFKEGIKNDEKLEVFIEGLKSNDFDTFYPYYNMKDYFDRTILSKYHLQSKATVTTNWFKTKIEAILKN